MPPREVGSGGGGGGGERAAAVWRCCFPLSSLPPHLPHRPTDEFHMESPTSASLPAPPQPAYVPPPQPAYVPPPQPAYVPPPVAPAPVAPAPPGPGRDQWTAACQRVLNNVLNNLGPNKVIFYEPVNPAQVRCRGLGSTQQRPHDQQQPGGGSAVPARERDSKLAGPGHRQFQQLESALPALRRHAVHQTSKARRRRLASAEAAGVAPAERAAQLSPLLQPRPLNPR